MRLVFICRHDVKKNISKRKKHGYWSNDQPALTCMCEYVPLEVVAASESAVAVVTNEILLHFQGKVVIHVHRWKYVL